MRRHHRTCLGILAMVCGLGASWPGPASAGIASLGIRAGWSGAQLGGDGGDAVAPELRSDVTLGGFVTLRIRPGLSFQPEISWASKGGQENFTVSSFPSPTEVTHTDFHVEHRLQYLEVPLLLRVDLPALGPIEFYALGGAAPAWLMGEDDSEIEITGSTTTSTTAGARPARASAFIYEELGAVGSPLKAQTFDLGLVGGLGFWIGSGRVRAGLEGRYTYGPMDMVPGGEFEFHNHAFAVTAAIEMR